MKKVGLAITIVGLVALFGFIVSGCTSSAKTFGSLINSNETAKVETQLIETEEGAYRVFTLQAPQGTNMSVIKLPEIKEKK